MRAGAYAVDTDRACAVARPKPGQDELRIQEDELEAACWMPMKEFASNPGYANRPVWREVRLRTLQKQPSTRGILSSKHAASLLQPVATGSFASCPW